MLREKFTENLNYSQFFSFEVLNYFDSICTDENYKWIVKYFDTLMKDENESAEKYNMHHIRPCCTFKDETHKNRKETQELGDEFNGNIIKLSFGNHILAHYCLWKMNPMDKKLRRAIWMMLGKIKFECLTEEEIIEFVKISEECKKANQTIKEREEYLKNYRELSKENRKLKRDSHKKEKSKYDKIWYKNHKKEKLEYSKTHKPSKEIVSKRNKKQYEKDRNKILNHKKIYNSRKCIDPLVQDEKFCTFSTLVSRKKKNKELYKNINPNDCLIKQS